MTNPYMYMFPPQNYNMPQNDSGFIGVQSEQEARLFPVGPGKSVTFRDESLPNTFYTKTMGTSPLDRPVFEKYRLVKEETEITAPEATECVEKKKDIDLSAYALKSDLDAAMEIIDVIQTDIAAIKERLKKK